jgi:Flp pilus assembly protein CpaB
MKRLLPLIVLSTAANLAVADLAYSQAQLPPDAIDLPKGKRAVSIQIDNDPNKIWLLPGSHVDIVKIDGSDKQRKTIVLARGVLILAFDVRNANDGDSTKCLVTVALDENETLRVNQAKESGVLRAVLRPPTNSGK